MFMYRRWAIILLVMFSSTAGFAADEKSRLWTDPIMSLFGMVCSSGVVNPTFDGINSYATAMHLQVIKEENKAHALTFFSSLIKKAIKPVTKGHQRSNSGNVK